MKDSAELQGIVEVDVHRALSLVRVDYPDAFLAGGYLRDRYMKIPPRDIDFFTFLPMIEGRNEVSFDATQSQANDFRIDKVERESRIDIALPIQIIHFSDEVKDSDPRTEVTHFLFGMQQILYDMERGFVDATEEFWDDIKNKTMTVCRCQGIADAIIGRRKYERLRERYPDWQLVVPERFRELYAEPDWDTLGAKL